jgi:membrane-associated phospholipid phosphatase
MPIARTRKTLQYFAPSLFICAALIYGLGPASAQTADSSGEKTHEAQPVSGTSPSDPTSENQQQPSTQTVTCGLAHLGRCLKDIALDQAGIWTSPLHLQSRDALWLVPFAGATAVAIHYDASAQQELGIDQTRIDTSNNVSLLGSTYATLAGGGALYAVGRLTHNDHLAETGRLGTEAVIDATLVAEALKLATNRERPDEGNGTGGFWPHGTLKFSDSFPSGHAIGSWALARVLASEYPNKLTQIGVYAFATAISVSRVTARKHFPSDALVGSVFGYMIGGYVVRHHAAEYVDSGFSFIPVVDGPTHTYGASIELRPDQLKLANLRRLAIRLRPN